MRYLLPWIVCVAGVALAGLHVAHRFPQAGPHDIARLIGSPTVTLEGTVVDLPLTRWNQARFILRGRSIVPSGYKGSVSVTLAFPDLAVAPGDYLKLRGWLSAPRPASSDRTFDEVGYWQSQNVYALMKVWSPESVVVYRPLPAWHPWAVIWRVRQNFCAFWQRALPEKEAALMIGMTVGGRGVLSPEFKAECIRAGVYHIVVISGQNVSVVIACALFLFQAIRWPRYKLWMVAIIPILFYARLTGADPPVLRASFMAIYALVSSGLRRDPPRFYGLCACAGIFLVCWPQALFGASFQLSFMATAALMGGFAMIPQTWWPKKKIPQWFCKVFAACLIVHLGSWPLFVFYFHQISLAGFLAPFVVYPLAAVGLCVGLAVGMIGAWLPQAVPGFILILIDGLLRLIMGCIAWLAQHPQAAIAFKPVSHAAMTLYYAGLFGILFLLYGRQKYAQKISPLRVYRARL